MTRDELIRMAVQCQLVTAGNRDGIYMDALANFAELVAVAERNQTWTQDHWTKYERKIAAEEREACADLVLTLTCMGNAKECFETAAAYIRARGNT